MKETRRMADGMRITGGFRWGFYPEIMWEHGHFVADPEGEIYQVVRLRRVPGQPRGAVALVHTEGGSGCFVDTDDPDQTRRWTQAVPPEGPGRRKPSLRSRLCAWHMARRAFS